MIFIIFLFLLFSSTFAAGQPTLSRASIKKHHSKRQISANHFLRELENSKNSLAFIISIPEGNFLRLNKGQKYDNVFGFLGISAGVEYYFSNKHSVSTCIGTLTDFMLPFPAPVDYMGSYERSFAFYVDIQTGTDFKRLHCDAGLQYNRTSFYERETVELFPNYLDTLRYSKQQDNLGCALSAYYRISRSFNLGINYYPSFIVFNNGAITTHYGHLLFLELIFRINVVGHKSLKTTSSIVLRSNKGKNLFHAKTQSLQRRKDLFPACVFFAPLREIL